MLIDPITGPGGDLANECSQAGVRDLRGPTAARTDHVVVMGRGTPDVGVLPARQVDPLDDPDLGEDVQRAEDGRASDAETTRACLGDEVRGRKVAGLVGDELRDGAARLGQAVTGAVQGGQEWGVVNHGRRLAQNACCWDSVSIVARRWPPAVPLGHMTFVGLWDRPELVHTERHGTGPCQVTGDTMTIEIGSQKAGRIGRRGGSRTATSLPIGEVDANIFSCPACSRPLGVGTSLCPNCGTHLIAGVRASRAVVFVGIGLFSGMILSAGLMAALSVAAPHPADLAVADAPPIVTPSQVAVASAAAPPVDPAVPSGAVSALRQSTLLNQRVLADAERLTAALAASSPSSAAIGPILRTLAATASFGTDLAPTVGTWDRADVVSRDLAGFYASIAETAEEGLSASFANNGAYVAAAERMLEIVSGLEALDTASRTLAASADLELPPLTVPSP